MSDPEVKGRLFVDHRGAKVEHTSWRTYLVLLHTLTGSSRVAARSVVGQLRDEHVEAVLERWCDHIFRIAKVTLEARGLERVRAGEPCVMISHHVSLLDTPCVVATWPGMVRMISKQELRKVPVFGRALEDAGTVFVDRGNKERAIQQLQKAKPLLERGVSLWVAAEGRRSRDGRLSAFKKGGFHTALQMGLPVVPVWIEGTLDVIPPDQWGSVTGQKVIVSYGEPIESEGRSLEDLMRATRESMLELAQDAGAREDVDAA